MADEEPSTVEETSPTTEEATEGGAEPEVVKEEESTAQFEPVVSVCVVFGPKVTYASGLVEPALVAFLAFLALPP